MDHVSHEELWTAHYQNQHLINDINHELRQQITALLTRLEQHDELQAAQNTLALRVAALELAAGTHATQTDNELETANPRLQALIDDQHSHDAYLHRESQRDLHEDAAATRLDQPGAYR